MSIEYSALESGLDRFIKLDKDHDFVGKNGLVDYKEKVLKSFVTLEVLVLPMLTRAVRSYLLRWKCGRSGNFRGFGFG